MRCNDGVPPSMVPPAGGWSRGASRLRGGMSRSASRLRVKSRRRRNAAATPSLFFYHNILYLQAVWAIGILPIKEFSEAKTRAFDGMDIQFVAFPAAVWWLAAPVAEKIQIINGNPNMLPFSR